MPTLVDGAGGGEAAPLIEPALAKINLTLRVLSRGEDGYHKIESLIAFADLGERIEARVSNRAGLDISGPTGGELSAGDNLILATDSAFRAVFPDTPLVSYRLDKHIPVAAGLGGGSADAAAALRLLARGSGKTVDEAGIAEIALGLGADVPVCLASAPALVTGIGEEVTRLAHMPSLALVLVNPGAALATKSVFAALGLATGQSIAEPALATLADEPAALEAAVLSGTNDLEPAACRLLPEVGEVLGEIARADGCRLSRMSGSGATCFGIFEDLAAAERAAHLLAQARPGWWMRAVVTGGSGVRGQADGKIATG